MVLSFGYCGWQNWQWHQHGPPSMAILMAMAVCRCNKKRIAQCSMSRGYPEATGRQHWATTHSVLPHRPSGQQANKQQSTNTPKKVAKLMAAAVRRYNTARIARWRRSRALLETTGSCHWVSIMSDNIKGTWLRHFFLMFSLSKP